MKRTMKLELPLLVSLGLAAAVAAETVSDGGELLERDVNHWVLVLEDGLRVQILPGTEILHDSGEPMKFSEIPLSTDTYLTYVDYKGEMRGGLLVASKICFASTKPGMM